MGNWVIWLYLRGMKCQNKFKYALCFPVCNFVLFVVSLIAISNHFATTTLVWLPPLYNLGGKNPPLFAGLSPKTIAVGSLKQTKHEIKETGKEKRDLSRTKKLCEHGEKKIRRLCHSFPLPLPFWLCKNGKKCVLISMFLMRKRRGEGGETIFTTSIIAMFQFSGFVFIFLR